MKTLFKILIVFSSVILLFIAYVAIPHTYSPDGALSKEIVKTHSYIADSQSFSAIDNNRPTSINRFYGGSDQRELDGRIWYPTIANGDIAEGAFPLIVYSHGFMSMHIEATYLAEFLAQRGYIVLAVDYPLSNTFAPGGPRAEDVINQPADVSFLIDTMLNRNKDNNDLFSGHIDPDRIAVAGLSLGGMTTALVAFHPQMRDPRIKAAVSIAGPTIMFDETFFATSDMPFMYVAGDIDAMVYYDSNALPILEKNPGSILMTISGASHSGFVTHSENLFRMLDNADSVGCQAIVRFIPEIEDGQEFIPGLGGKEQGILSTSFDKSQMPCQQMPLPSAIRPGLQHVFTQLAVYSFFDSHFSKDDSSRQKSSTYLTQTLAKENSLVNVQVSEKNIVSFHQE
ncbi:MAG: hypothetical protein KUG82_03185 [Pseudomonadales bacterium]|nr:hypothetical protein [Pseudomonadales bacterium]